MTEGGGDVEPEDYEINYLDKAALISQTGLKDTTLSNTLSRLVKENKIHRQKDTRGMYGWARSPTRTWPPSNS